MIDHHRRAAGDGHGVLRGRRDLLQQLRDQADVVLPVFIGRIHRQVQGGVRGAAPLSVFIGEDQQVRTAGGPQDGQFSIISSGDPARAG